MFKNHDWIQYRYGTEDITARNVFCEENGMEHLLTSSIFRWSLLWLISRQFLTSSNYTPQLEQYTNCSSYRGVSDLDMLLSRNRRTLSLTLKQSAVSPRTAHSHRADSTAYTLGILGGHPTVHPAHAMGRLDKSSSYYLDYRVLCPHMRDEANTREQESKKEADRGEC